MPPGLPYDCLIHLHVLLDQGSSLESVTAFDTYSKVMTNSNLMLPRGHNVPSCSLVLRNKKSRVICMKCLMFSVMIDGRPRLKKYVTQFIVRKSFSMFNFVLLFKK